MSNLTGERSAEDLLGVVSLRYDLLSCLSEEPSEQPALVERLDSSKATVYRAISELDEADLVVHGSDGYALSAPGSALLAAYERFRATAETVSAASELLRALPEDVVVPPSFLRGAEVVAASGATSYEPGARIASLVTEATHIRELAKAHTQSDAVEVYSRVIVEHETDAAIVFDPEMAEHLRALDDPRVAAVLDSDHVTVHGTTELPFGLLVVQRDDGSERAALAVYDANGLLRGVLVNDTPPALEWAEATYERYSRKASDEATPEV